VIPARDEETLLPGCLAALRAAAKQVPEVAVEVTVVADACRDRTAEVARRAGAHVVESGRGNVGAARASGFAAALDRHGAVDGLWMATTDADSRVPAGWLAAHLRSAARHDARLGTVALDDADRRRFPSWVEVYDHGCGPTRHRHVHGANLGVAAAAYRRVGGFRSLVSGEDADLVERLRAVGVSIDWSVDEPVLTSGRQVSRAPRGVAADLRASLEAVPRIA
jgi:glycosyltransferase involved in cell wall biosynthesis